MAQPVLETKEFVVLTLVLMTSPLATLPDGLGQLSFKSHGGKLMAKLAQELTALFFPEPMCHFYI